MNEDKKIEFLYNAIKDAQELIRFTDSKTAFIITILGAFFLGIFAALEDLVTNIGRFSVLFWILLVVLLILIVFCVVITKRIISPSNNPSKNIHLGNLNEPTLKFFLAPNNYHQSVLEQYYKNKDIYKLEETLESFLLLIEGATPTIIIKSLSFELLKVSYIRNIKNDRFDYLLNSLLITTILFIVVVLLYFIEKHDLSGCG